LAKKEPNAEVKQKIDRQRYLPFYLIRIANSVSRGASKAYIRHFGVGVIEWRILSFLSIDRNMTAHEICAALEIDKAAASRNLREMERKGYILTTSDPNDTRKRPIQLTHKGAELHDRMIKVALYREQHLRAGFSEKELDQLLGLLRRLVANLPVLESLDYSAVIDPAHSAPAAKPRSGAGTGAAKPAAPPRKPIAATKPARPRRSP
jgi:DNA-binding MarR family transcriptional regulator